MDIAVLLCCAEQVGHCGVGVYSFAALCSIVPCPVYSMLLASSLGKRVLLKGRYDNTMLMQDTGRETAMRHLVSRSPGPLMQQRMSRHPMCKHVDD